MHPPNVLLPVPEVTPDEFERAKGIVRSLIGIHLTDAKRALVENRLAKRLRARGVRSFTEYLDFIEDPREESERSIFVDLMTTNETRFFREPGHYAYLGREILPELSRMHTGEIRIWCAAASTGEEPYSIAMVLADRLGWKPWSITATDISTRVLETAVNAVYPMDRLREIPRYYVEKFLLKGKGERSGSFRVMPEIRTRINFRKMNLMEMKDLPHAFDCIFLRNVLIYFDSPTKSAVIKAALEHMRPGGFLFVGHAESCSHKNLVRVSPSVYKYAA